MMKKRELFVFILAIVFCMLCRADRVSAASSKVGVMISDESGKYTWYDLNESEQNTENIVRYSENGVVMMPVSLLSSYMTDINYNYNSTTKKLTLTNKKNGRKIVGKVNSTVLTWYKKQGAKGSKVKMKASIYIAEDGAVMIPADALRYVMWNKGYSCKKEKNIKGFGYDTTVFKEVYIYNTRAAFSGMPKATVVKGLSNTVRVTIPEGYSVPQVFELLVNKGVCESTKGLFDACQNYSFNPERYPFLATVDRDENRCYRFEGYLFPNTYDFYRLCPPQDAIGVCLRGTNANVTSAMENRAKDLNMTMDQVLTLASIVEKEGKKAEDKKMIASVLYNRLNIKMKLQSDAPSIYIDKYVTPNFTGDIEKYKGLYNTYKCPALPSGPICNPGKQSIMAALYPAESNDLFFFSDKEGNYYFSETYEEHLANIAAHTPKENEEE